MGIDFSLQAWSLTGRSAKHSPEIEYLQHNVNGILLVPRVQD